MTKLPVWKCDCCHRRFDSSGAHWEDRPSGVVMRTPPDGINGGDNSMEDCCRECRVALWSAIRSAINEQREKYK